VLLAELRRAVAPRKRGWVPLGVVGGLVVSGLGLAEHAEVGQGCEGPGARLQGVWDDARRQEVEAAILGTALSYAADTSVRVQARLDDYASAWVREHTEVCEATSVRQEQSPEVMDLRMACLYERRFALHEAVNVLTEVDATRVEHAVELVTHLPTLDGCDDVETLRAERPPEDPAVAAEVATLREQLVQAQILAEAGDHDESMAMADAIVARAEVLSHPPLLVTAWFVRGRAAEGLGRYADAARDFEQAYLAAAEHGLDRVEAQAVVDLTMVVGSHQARYEAGLQWGATALALARGLRREPETEAMALDVVGFVLLGQGQLPAALSHFQRALAIKEQVQGPEHLDLAVSLHAMATVLVNQGKFEEALDGYQRALEIYGRALGPNHPNVARTLASIGNVRLRQGELSQALVEHPAP